MSPRARASHFAFSGEVVPMIEMQCRYARCAYELGGQNNLTADRLDVDAKILNKWLADDDRR